MTEKEGKRFQFSEKNVLWISKIMQETGNSIEDVVNSLVSRGIDSFNSDTIDVDKSREIIRSLGFIEAHMLYSTKKSPEPVEYQIRIKEVYLEEGIHYIKAKIRGDEKDVNFRVDQIHDLVIGGVSVSHPLNFFLSGESFNKTID